MKAQTIKESLRVAKHLENCNNTAIAKALDKSESTISQWCDGESRITLEELHKLAKFFNVSVSKFMKWGKK